jgi:hypothetical protein
LAAGTLAGAFFGCGGNQAATYGQRTAEVRVVAASLPTDGQCAHVVATRLADFQVTEYKGPLASATFQGLVGDNRVTATAYAQPCNAEPTNAPWITTPQIVTFANAPNTLNLQFQRNVAVTVVPGFNPDPAPLLLRPGTLVRTGRNGEDAAGPNFTLDGWEVKQIAFPSAMPTETTLFSVEGKGIPYSPRGMAHTSDGNFVFQLLDTASPLYVFNSSGNPIATWAVSYAAGKIQWNGTDGIEAVDATHLVRTGYLNAPINCDASNHGCVQAGLDILEKQVAMDGTISYQVTKQILLPELMSVQLNLEYPVGVAPVAMGTKFAVTTLPAAGGTSHLTILNADGTVAAGPTTINGDVEGLYDDGSGRLIGVDYTGNVTDYNDTTAVALMDHASFAEGQSIASPASITWRSAATMANPNGSYLVLSGDGRLYSTSPAFDSASSLGIDLSGFNSLSAVEYRSDTDEIALLDRLPPVDTATGTRIPVVNFYNLTTLKLDSTVKLLPGVALPLRPISLAFVPAPAMSMTPPQLVVHYRRPQASADPAVDAVAFVHNAATGALVSSFDLAPLGFARIQSVSYAAASSELVFVVVDIGGTTRILTTDLAGKPHHSYRIDPVPYLSDVAPISSGANAGDVGIVEGQPSYFARIRLP